MDYFESLVLLGGEKILQSFGATETVVDYFVIDWDSGQVADASKLVKMLGIGKGLFQQTGGVELAQ
jgi:hypothetical protein